MKKVTSLALVLTCSFLFACQKKTEDASTAASAAAAAAPTVAEATKPAASAEPTEAQREMEEKKRLMDYASMEDSYINDPLGQWANAAKASSVFGDDSKSGPSDSNLAKNVQGPVDGESWNNNKQDIGFDWLETSYEKPVTAKEVRVVFENGKGVEAINKIELQDTAGNWSTLWSGISDQKRDTRGNRTWFVRKVEKATGKTKAVRITLANNLERGYKVVDAVQLVGE